MVNADHCILQIFTSTRLEKAYMIVKNYIHHMTHPMCEYLECARVHWIEWRDMFTVTWADWSMIYQHRIFDWPRLLRLDGFGLHEDWEHWKFLRDVNWDVFIWSTNTFDFQCDVEQDILPCQIGWIGSSGRFGNRKFGLIDSIGWHTHDSQMLYPTCLFQINLWCIDEKQSQLGSLERSSLYLALVLE